MEFPLLLLPGPSVAARNAKPPGFPRLGKPTRSQQGARLDGRWAALQKALRNKEMRIESGGATSSPEQILVLETIGTVADFFRAVNRVEGMEWLSELEREFSSDEYFYDLNKTVKSPLKGRLYLLTTSDSSLQQVLRLWNMWKQGDDKFPTGMAPWKQLFSNLRNLRSWNSQDRVESTGVLEDWALRLEYNSHEPVIAELELWFRSSHEQRLRAENNVRVLLGQLDGLVVQSCQLEAIRYHAILIRIDRKAVIPFKDRLGKFKLFQCEELQFAYPVGQVAFRAQINESNLLPPVEPPTQRLSEPVAALLDGLPLEQHNLLQRRLLVDDPEEWANNYEPSYRQHATAMASLIVHGDLNQSTPEPPIESSVYVRPVMNLVAEGHASFERCPVETLLVDRIHSALRRIVEGEGTENAAAPSVCVVNFSIGDSSRPFDREISPLARLLDWFSNKYGILIIVSAGNLFEPLDLENLQADQNTTDIHLSSLLLRNSSSRRLLSPGEAVNTLTVGSIHADFCLEPTPKGFQIFPSSHIPAPYSRHGPGYCRVIKPEVVLPGGRIAYNRFASKLKPIDNSNYVGQKVAAPTTSVLSLNSSVLTSGTSNSAALATRQAVLLHEMISKALPNQQGWNDLHRVPLSLLLKTLIVHSADYAPERKRAVKNAALEAGIEFKESLVRKLMGYGEPTLNRSMQCGPVASL